MLNVSIAAKTPLLASFIIVEFQGLEELMAIIPLNKSLTKIKSSLTVTCMLPQTEFERIFCTHFSFKKKRIDYTTMAKKKQKKERNVKYRKKVHNFLSAPF